MRYRILRWVVRNRGAIQAAMTAVIVVAEGVRELTRARRKKLK